MEEQMSIEAMKQALEALEYCKHLAEGQRVWGGTEWSYPFPWKRIFDSTTKSLHTIRTAIEQAEKQAEPFGYFQYDVKLDAWIKSKTNNGIAFYTTPPAAQREWVGLTEIEICDIEAEELTSASSETFSFARAIEAKLKEKNT
jgi:hypothetical protein